MGCRIAEHRASASAPVPPPTARRQRCLASADDDGAMLAADYHRPTTIPPPPKVRWLPPAAGCPLAGWPQPLLPPGARRPVAQSALMVGCRCRSPLPQGARSPEPPRRSCSRPPPPDAQYYEVAWILAPVVRRPMPKGACALRGPAISLLFFPFFLIFIFPLHEGKRRSPK